MADKMADWVILEILASWINWLFRLVKWEILPVLPSWELSGVGILANKARGPPGPRALLASIPTPLNLQLGNIGSIFQLIIRKDQKPLLQPTNTSSIPQSILQSQLSWPYMFSQSVNISSITQSAHQMLNNPPFPFHQLFPLASEHVQSWLSSDQVSCQRRRRLRHLT